MRFEIFGKRRPSSASFAPSGVHPDVFDLMMPILSRHFQVIIPAIPGHEPDEPKTNFTSIEQIASDIEQGLKKKKKV